MSSPTILTTFLVGLALGARRVRRGSVARSATPSGSLRGARSSRLVSRSRGSSWSSSQPHEPTPGKPLETLTTLIGTSILTVLPVTLMLGIAFPAVVGAAPRRRRPCGAGIRIAPGGEHHRRDRRQSRDPVLPHSGVRLAAPCRTPRCGQRDARDRAGMASRRHASQTASFGGRRRRPRRDPDRRCVAGCPCPTQRGVHRLASEASSSRQPKTRSHRSRRARSARRRSCGCRARP